MLGGSKDNRRVLCRAIMRLRPLDLSPLSLFAVFTGFFFCSTCRLCLTCWNLDDVLFNVLESEDGITRRKARLAHAQDM